MDVAGPSPARSLLSRPPDAASNADSRRWGARDILPRCRCGGDAIVGCGTSLVRRCRGL